MDNILIVNAGSSSLKFEVFEAAQRGDLKRRIKGQIDGIGTRPRLRARAADGSILVEQTYSVEEIPDVRAAMRTGGAWLRQDKDIHPVAVGHRVVHGGPDYGHPVLIDSKVLADLERYTSLAPLHQPNNLAAIRAILERFPDMPQVACFDTAFHRSHDALADHFAIPEHFYREGVRRYGFHGLSYEYIAGHLPAVAPEIASGRVIVAHLGSGASMCAMAAGRSVESTMGFTALDGLPMGTRPGQIDPGVVLHLIMEKKMSAEAVQDLFYHDCGLKGLSGISNDVRELETSSDPRAAFAIDYFVYRAGLSAGLLAAALGGIDAFVFTAGIGENSASMRARIAAKLEWLGARLDPVANSKAQTLISTRDSGVALLIVPTDEELMIARHTMAVLSSKMRSATAAGD